MFFDKVSLYWHYIYAAVKDEYFYFVHVLRQAISIPATILSDWAIMVFW